MKKKADPKSITSQRIREIMGEMTQGEFANKVGSSQPVICKILQGDEPSVNVLKGISQSCGVSVDWLLGLSSKKYTTGYSTFVEENPTTYSDVVATLIRMFRKNSISFERGETDPDDYNAYRPNAEFVDSLCIKDHIIGDLLVSVDSLMKNNPETVDSWLKTVISEYDIPLLQWDDSKELQYLVSRQHMTSLNILKNIAEKNN
jgi:transcriptional regulator with XRE-family HTH domain